MDYLGKLATRAIDWHRDAARLGGTWRIAPAAACAVDVGAGQGVSTARPIRLESGPLCGGSLAGLADARSPSPPWRTGSSPPQADNQAGTQGAVKGQAPSSAMLLMIAWAAGSAGFLAVVGWRCGSWPAIRSMPTIDEGPVRVADIEQLAVETIVSESLTYAPRRWSPARSCSACSGRAWSYPRNR